MSRTDVQILGIFIALVILASSCGYKKKYEQSLQDAKKNQIYEDLYEEQKEITYQLQDSIEQYKTDLNVLIYRLNKNQLSTDVPSEDIQSDREKELDQRLKNMQRKNAALLETIAKLDSVILVNDFLQDTSASRSSENYSYISKKVHLLNTLRNIQSQFPASTELFVGERDLEFVVKRDVLFASTYSFTDNGIEIIRQMTQALNPLFGHEVDIQTEFSLEDPYSDLWKESIQGQIMIAQLMKRFGANQERIDGKNKFVQTSEEEAQYRFVFSPRPITTP
jgi:hypothetical protein